MNGNYPQMQTRNESCAGQALSAAPSGELDVLLKRVYGLAERTNEVFVRLEQLRVRTLGHYPENTTGGPDLPPEPLNAVAKLHNAVDVVDRNVIRIAEELQRLESL